MHFDVFDVSFILWTSCQSSRLILKIGGVVSVQYCFQHAKYYKKDRFFELPPALQCSQFTLLRCFQGFVKPS